MIHTPGSWIIRDMSDDFQRQYTIEPDRQDDLRSVICRLSDMELCPEHGGDIETNAWVIAAAPDLLDAAKAALARFREDCCDGYHANHPVTLLTAAIAKAEGREP